MSGRWQKLAWAAAVAAYFCYFARASIGVKFAPDDLMNLDYYWRLGPWRVIAAFFAPWLGGYRPLGGLFYLPLFRIFGLDPRPYHAVAAGLLAVNVFLVYRLARALRCSDLVAGLAAFLASYHAGLSFLYFNTSFIYDILCSLFYLAAVTYYVRRRTDGGALSVGQITIFAALYWCALNSKEMALTLPGVLLAYECLYPKRPSFRGIAAATLLAVPILLRALVGPGALATMPIYRPEFSPARVLAFQRDAMGDLFEAWNFFTLPWVAGVWALITIVAWWSKRPVLRFCWWWLLLTPIPIELLEGRTNACLALPFYGVAILAATTFTEVADRVGALLPGRQARQAVSVAILALGLYAWGFHNARIQHHLIAPQMRELGRETATALAELDAIHPRVRPHSTVVFLDDPFQDFDMAFIADLYFHRHDVNVKLERKTPMRPEELAAVEHLIAYEQGHFRQIR